MFYSSQYELSFRNVISHDGCKGISQKIFVKVNTFKNAILLLEIHILQFKSPRFFQPQKKIQQANLLLAEDHNSWLLVLLLPESGC